MVWDRNLNWIVPLRRVVVTQRLTYEEAMRAWELALRLPEHKEKMCLWYGIAARDYDDACDTLLEWRYMMHYSGILYCAVETTATADASRHFWVRAWKGPLRVLQETAGGVSSLVPDLMTGEINDPDAEFLEGDIVEFPLFKFLVHCGKDGYEGLCFNPEGSPFLGNTVVDDAGDPPVAGQDLHDNMLAMRFQLLFNLGMAGFYHQAAVYQSGAGSGLLGEPGGTRVYARGMMYGAVLKVCVRPDIRNPNPSDPHWLVASYHWGRRNAEVVPTLDSYNRVLLPGQPLTPAWSCSPCTLTVMYILLDADRWGESAVNNEYDAGRLSQYRARRLTRCEILGADNPREASITVNLLPENPGAPEVDGVRQAPQRLGDLNVVCLYRHEQALLRIYPHCRLLDMGSAGTPPHTGCICVYNPATGRDYFDGVEGQTSMGQLWKFEASGAMHTEREPQRMGAGPHHWDRIEENIVRFVKTPGETRHGGGYHGIWYRAADPTASNLQDMQRFNHFIMFDLNEDALAGLYFPGKTYRPIVSGDYRLKVLSRQRLRRVRATDPDREYNDYKRLYAERAVPYLTLDEFIQATTPAGRSRSDYPPAQDLLAEITAAENPPAQSTAPATGQPAS